MSAATVIGLFAVAAVLAQGRLGFRAARILLWRHVRVYWSYKFAVVSAAATGLLVAFLLVVVGKALVRLFVPVLPEDLGDGTSVTYAAFLVTGFMAWPLLWSGYSIASRNIRIEQVLGMLEVLIPTRLGVSVLPFAYLALALFTSVLTGVFSLTFFHYAFGLPLPLGDPALLASLVAVLVAGMFMAWGLGLVLGGLATIVREVEPASGMLRLLMLAFSGVILPVEALPDWLRPLANLLPLTHAFRALRLVLLQREPVTAFLPVFTDLVLYALFLSLVGVYVFDRCVDRARRFGTLSGY